MPSGCRVYVACHHRQRRLSRAASARPAWAVAPVSRSGAATSMQGCGCRKLTNRPSSCASMSVSSLRLRRKAATVRGIVNLGTLGGFPNPPAMVRRPAGREQSSPAPHATSRDCSGRIRRPCRAITRRAGRMLRVCRRSGLCQLSRSATLWSTERFASRREIADLRRVPSLLVGQIRRVFSLLAPRAARNCAIPLGPANRSVL
jgi:hypothetical protein